MGKPVQISKCQLRINTFQFCSMQAAARGWRSHMLCQAFHPHWGHAQNLTHHRREPSHHATISDWKWDLAHGYSYCKAAKWIKYLAVVWNVYLQIKKKKKFQTVREFNSPLVPLSDSHVWRWWWWCWLLAVINATPAHMSRQMMGHLCLTGATGITRPLLTHLIITPSGHGKSQWRQSCLDQWCPTGELLSDSPSDMRLLLISCRHGHKISGSRWELLFQLRDTLPALKKLG